MALGEQGKQGGERVKGTEQKMVTLPQGGVAAAINKGFSVQGLVSKARTACLSPKLPPPPSL